MLNPARGGASTGVWGRNPSAIRLILTETPDVNVEFCNFDLRLIPTLSRYPVPGVEARVRRGFRYLNIITIGYAGTDFIEGFMMTKTPTK
ncbi:hypothetical protein ANME2D_03273 [Candidatus Methanoperedens nitroreducens]|uniref:Uncharacterized protein n=2 Tax=Candidatus Methanoperedens nitratireducens TaxID=1392998 RepID=A0A062V155_9EURY|nr:hypothetical protein ANME2D_03273 [Candidatus Methanoperedens nitroreducens]